MNVKLHFYCNNWQKTPVSSTEILRGNLFPNCINFQQWSLASVYGCNVILKYYSFIYCTNKNKYLILQLVNLILYCWHFNTLQNRKTAVERWIQHSTTFMKAFVTFLGNVDASDNWAAKDPFLLCRTSIINMASWSTHWDGLQRSHLKRD